jgi:predicted DNA-binding transcriptional regulator AlpA
MRVELPAAPAELVPLAVDAAGVAKLLGVSMAHLFALKSSGRFGPQPIRFGRSIRYRVDELKAWLAAGAPSLERWRILKGGAR